MPQAAFVTDAVAELAADFSGQLLTPGQPGYDDARQLHNGLIDKRPALIARCRGIADVVDALALARRLRLEIAVRGGGHNVAGRASIDGGVMIDLSPMRGVHVDPAGRTVRVQGGATWAELNRDTQVHGLAVTGGVVSSTGVAGLTLGGGVGWLMCRYGLALDNLLSVELVTADGRVVEASREHEPDLFWALRGGGGNFGVATSFVFRLHPVGPGITGGLVAHPFDRARETLRFFRDSTRSLPDDHMIVAAMIHAPDGSDTKLAALVSAHCGAADEGARAMAPLKAFGAPVVDSLGPMTYCALNRMLDGAYPKGALNYWKSSFLDRLSDEAIDALVACYAACPTPMSQLLIEHFHGEATRVDRAATAFPHRAEGYNLCIIAQWTDRADSERCIAWARDTHERMRPFLAEGRYVNYLGDDEPGDSVAAAYGANHRRLQQIKARFDPSNVFRMNQNVQPLR